MVIDSPEVESLFAFTAFFGDGDAFLSVEIVAGERVFYVGEFVGGTGKDEVTAAGAASGADVHKVVCGADDGLFVLDDHEGISFFAESLEDFDEAGRVAWVETDAGFVHYEEGVYEGGAEAGGEVDTFDFTSGEAPGWSVEAEVGETDLVEIGEAGMDLLAEEGDAGVVFFCGKFFDKWEEVADGEGGDFGQSEAGAFGGGEAKIQGFGLEASAVAVFAAAVGAVAAEEDADVHFVGSGFEPLEVSFDSIPEVVAPDFFGAGSGGAFAVYDEVLFFFGEFFEGDVDVDIAFVGVAEKVALAFLGEAGLEGADDSIGDAEGAVGESSHVVDADAASKATATRAGAEGVIKRKEAGRGGADVDVAMSAVPALGGGVKGGGSGFGFDEVDFSFAEAEGSFDGFLEAALVFFIAGDAVVDDFDALGEAAAFGRFVGANDLAVEEDAQVALGLEEGEKIGGFFAGAFGDVEGEGDEDFFSVEFF